MKWRLFVVFALLSLMMFTMGATPRVPTETRLIVGGVNIPLPEGTVIGTNGIKIPFPYDIDLSQYTGGCGAPIPKHIKGVITISVYVQDIDGKKVMVVPKKILVAKNDDYGRPILPFQEVQQ